MHFFCVSKNCDSFSKWLKQIFKSELKQNCRGNKKKHAEGKIQLCCLCQSWCWLFLYRGIIGAKTSSTWALAPVDPYLQPPMLEIEAHSENMLLVNQCEMFSDCSFVNPHRSWPSSATFCSDIQTGCVTFQEFKFHLILPDFFICVFKSFAANYKWIK